jgi:hypothetical protein
MPGVYQRPRARAVLFRRNCLPRLGLGQEKTVDTSRKRLLAFDAGLASTDCDSCVCACYGIRTGPSRPASPCALSGELLHPGIENAYGSTID